MSPIQQMLLGVGAVATKTYVDDVFSTYLWRGNGSNSSTRTMSNGVDLAGEGGMVWIKQRTGTNEAKIVDTVRGLTGSSPYYVMPSESNAQGDRAWNWSFLNNGFSFNQDYGDINGNNENYASWTFRKSPAFTIKQYTGSGSTQSISHDLGSVPGMIMVKRTDSSAGWAVYHRGVDGTSPENYALGLDNSDARSESANYWNDTAPTATHFTVKTSGSTNTSGATYIAYIFAGGESTAATARSVEFDGSDDYLTTSTSSDYTIGTDDFTLECWCYQDARAWAWLFDGNGSGANEFDLYLKDNGVIYHRTGGTVRILTLQNVMPVGQWAHIALVRSSGTTRLYVNGIQQGAAYSPSSTENLNFTALDIGRRGDGSNYLNGKVSNLRFVKGTAVYTSSFTPPTEPLTNITNTKLLCCNSSTITGSTVGTITATGFTEVTSQTSYYASGNNISGPGGTGEYRIWLNSGNNQFYYNFGGGNTSIGGQDSYYAAAQVITTAQRTAGTITSSQDIYPGGTSGYVATIVRNLSAITASSTDSPFDDPAGFVFGDSGDQNVIKTGVWTAESGGVAEVYLGFEAQFIMIKTTGSGSWLIWDSMRGIVTGGADPYIMANQSNAESNTTDFIDLTATGFKVTQLGSSGTQFTYIAIRRPDGYVGKPPSLGTDVFAMDTGNGSSTIPAYDSGFPVDFGLDRRPASTEDWYTSARLIGAKWLKTNANSTETSGASYLWDSNVGYIAGNWADSDYQSWMFKRHAGFDVVTYEGTGAAREIPHSLSKTVEMMWVKNRDSSSNWMVYHKNGNNSNTNDPENYYLKLDETSPAYSTTDRWNQTAPTATCFSVGSATQTNNSGDNFIAMLFASVDGISKVGSYTGTGSSGNTITLGFQARFIFLKRVNSTSSWPVWDSLRTTASPFTKEMYFDATDSQGNATYFTVSSTGFTFNSNDYNGSSDKFIYYAHA